MTNIVLPFNPELHSQDDGLGKYNIMLAYRGSIAHGMYIPNTDPNSVDDVDLVGVTVPPISYYYGLNTYANDGTKEIKIDQWDIVVYEIRKTVRMLRNGNPNILSLLWTDPAHFISVSPEGQWLIDNRSLFLTNEIHRSFYGYAMGQMHKMEHGAFNGFMGARRKALVEKFGYDCKNAAHLIRLLRMGCEAMETGELFVNRSGIDANELLEIKTGGLELDDVKSLARGLFAHIELARKNSKLPNKPDERKINNLLIDIIKSRHLYYEAVGVE